jgi:hypothetical protein
MRSSNLWSDLIVGFADVLISEMFSDNRNDKKKYQDGGMVEDKFDSSENTTEDLGYAVVVDDNGNEIRNY